MIKIAITKGRIEKQVCKLLAEAGFDMDPIFNKDRELLIETKDGNPMMLLHFWNMGLLILVL